MTSGSSHGECSYAYYAFGDDHEDSMDDEEYESMLALMDRDTMKDGLNQLDCIDGISKTAIDPTLHEPCPQQEQVIVYTISDDEDEDEDHETNPIVYTISDDEDEEHETNPSSSSCIEPSTNDHYHEEDEQQELVTIDRNFPPGFRFLPTDAELVVHYLRKKVVLGQVILDHPMPEVDLYAHCPIELTNTHPLLDYANEWYFFTKRGKKNKNGNQPSRTTVDGYWKTIAKFKEIRSMGSIVGYKRVLDYFFRQPGEGERENKYWKMAEYTLTMELEMWVLCKIYKKKKMAKCEAKEEED